MWSRGGACQFDSLYCLSLVDEQESQDSSRNDYLIYHSRSSLRATNSCVQIPVDISGTKPNDEKSRKE